MINKIVGLGAELQFNPVIDRESYASESTKVPFSPAGFQNSLSDAQEISFSCR